MITKKTALWLLIAAFATILPVASWATPEDVSKWKQFNSRDYIYDMAIVDNYLWAGIPGGLVLANLDRPNLQRYFHKLSTEINFHQVYQVAPDNQGGLWLATDNGASYLSSDRSWHHVSKDNSPLPVDNLQSLATDALGGVWFGTWGGGAYYLNKNNTWQSLNTVNSKLPGNYIYTVLPLPSGGVWFGTDSRGAAFLDADGQWQTFNNTNSGLPGNDVLDILVDSTGGTWFATYQGVGYLSNDNEWQTFNTVNNSLPSDLVYSLALAPDGSILVGTDNGLASLNANGSIKFNPQEMWLLPDTPIKSIAIDQMDNIWLGTWGQGLYKLGPTSGASNASVKKVSLDIPSTLLPKSKVLSYYETYGIQDSFDKFSKDNLSTEQITGSATDSLGGTWLTTRDAGLIYLDGAGNVTVYNSENSSLPTDSLNAIVAVEDTLWIGTWGGGLVRLSGITDTAT
ncbi:MAG: hypothetical protein SCK28_11750, partial [Bacillota bacterium]|nr:hypothetical protein [Bacillota bacterium]